MKILQMNIIYKNTLISQRDEIKFIEVMLKWEKKLKEEELILIWGLTA